MRRFDQDFMHDERYEGDLGSMKEEDTKALFEINKKKGENSIEEFKNFD